MTQGTIGVVGAGQMGAGIAHVAALAGKKVVLVDVTPDLAGKGLKGIEKNLSRQVDKGKVAAVDRDAALARIVATADLSRLAEAGLVVEAIVENESVKRDLLARVDALVPPLTILATNTSSISITRLAAGTKRPERFIGMHFMNPVPVMALVEVIRGIATSDETTEAVLALARELGKTPLLCRDFPGFVANRILLPMLNEAFFAVHEGVATPEAVDGIMKLGMNHPMGPLALADFIGLDTCLPCPLLVQMVDAGWQGRKTGRGFYRYDGPGGERLP
jgi:3-hydroxybutyryl-CoA dehydrogenase